MKNKGFTLIELLASITILGMVAIIAFPAILNLLSDSQNKIDKSKEEYVISAAREYINDKGYTESTKELKVVDLINEGYISETSISQKDDSKIYGGCIKVSESTKSIDVGGEPKTITSYTYSFHQENECTSE